MARTNTLGNFLTDVANAIREKNPNAPTPLSGADFDTRILEIETGGTGGGSVALPKGIYYTSGGGDRNFVVYGDLTNMYISASQYVKSSNGKIQLVNKATGEVTEMPSGGINLAATLYLGKDTELETVQKVIKAYADGSFSWTWGTKESARHLGGSTMGYDSITELFRIQFRDYWLLVNTATPVATFVSGVQISRNTTSEPGSIASMKYQDTMTPVAGPALPPGNYFLLDKLGAAALFNKASGSTQNVSSKCAADPAYVV